MRGSGTSPRELRAQESAGKRASAHEAELDRLVTAIPTTYAAHPELATEKIMIQFAEDPDRLERSLAALGELVTT